MRTGSINILLDKFLIHLPFSRFSRPFLNSNFHQRTFVLRGVLHMSFVVHDLSASPDGRAVALYLMFYSSFTKQRHLVSHEGTMGPSAVMTQSPTSQSRVVSLLESFVRDLKFTIRSLRRKPGFTFVVVLSLALGIGANAAIFSVVDAILLRPLAIPHPDNLIMIDVAASKMQQFGNTSYLDWKDFTSRSRAFESLAIE